MFSQSTLQKLQIIIDRIESIEQICADFGIEKALQDSIVTQPAIMKHFDIMHEQIVKLQNGNEVEILDSISSKHLKGLREVRNISSHDYYFLDFDIIEYTILNDLPTFKAELKRILDSQSKKA